jgi:hypothetical protein
MIKATDQNHRIIIEPLTPIHIGTGMDLDPLGYIIDNDELGHRLHHVDLTAWVEDWPDNKELVTLFSNTPLPAIRSFLREHVDPDVYALSSAEVISRQIVDDYERHLRDQHSQNQLLISPAIKNGNNFALIIPGSSIKGAMSTAIIDLLDREHGLALKQNQQPRDYIQRLQTFMGKITESCMRDLKISDFEAPIGKALITTAKEKRLRPNDRQSTPKSPCEVLPSKILGGDSPMAGTINLGARRGGPKTDCLVIDNPRERLDLSLDLEDLFRICRDFYVKRYKNERDLFYAQPHFSETRKQLEPLDEIIGNLKSNQTLIRLGHYSHIECMTITDNNPQTPRRQGKVMPYGTTRTLADSVYPFGWALVSVCTEQEYEKIRDVKQQADQDYLAKKQEKRVAIIAQKKQAEEQRLMEQQKEEEERRRLEEEKARLETMSEEERLLYDFQRGALNENQVVEIFQRIDSFELDYKVKIADEIRKYWQAEKKWSKKDTSKKQTDKVKAIKKILGLS